jgi:flagellar basal-body rod protein FlgG
MYEAMSIAATGLQIQQSRLDTIADNIANINTIGFKSSRLDFKDALYTAGYGPAYTPGGNQQKGHGVLTSSITRNFSNGNLAATGNDLDFAIEGDGFLELVDASGRTLYTRSGNLYTTTVGDTMYLVDADGSFIQNMDGTRIEVPPDTTKTEVSEVGDISFYNGSTLLKKDRLGFYRFPVITGLVSVGGSNFETTEVSGEKEYAAGAKIKQGYLEDSNVNTSVEFTRLIRAQRAFTLAGRALSTADNMEGIANNMKK